MYRIFSTVVILDQVLRQTGSDPAAEMLRDLLSRLRNGNISHDDWQLLLQRSPQYADNVQDFTDAVRLFYTKDSVAQYNLRRNLTL